MSRTGPEPSAGRRFWSAFRIDVSPLRRYRDFRLLFLASSVSLFGDAVTMVAAPLQMKQLTGSFLAVGLIGVFQFVPLVGLGLWGGALADAFDRRRVILLAQGAELLGTLGLLVNALLADPHPWVIYAATVVATSGMALRRPSQDALQAQVVGHEDQARASALTGIEYNLGALVAPGLGGLLALYSMPLAYLTDLLTFVVSLVLLSRLRSAPRPAGTGEPVSLRGIGAGIRYAAGRRELLGTYLVDIIAMTLAMPEAIYPFLADSLHQDHALGLLYSAGSAGGLLASATSGWTARVHRHGLAIVLAGVGWGAGMALAGVAPGLWWVLVALALAGAADMVSGLFRQTVWNQTIPEHLRGRLAGLELLSYSTGPTLGNARAGAMGQVGGARFSIGVGGLACVVGVLACAVALPPLVRYDNRTDPHAVAERERRAAGSPTSDP